MPIRLSSKARLVHFPSTDGLRLEGRLLLAHRDRAVVLCHPHPLHGGSMLTPVIMTAEQAFQEAGYTTLAFNFRGVGGSQGRHGEGRDEVADVEGALAFTAEQLGHAPARQTVAGFSFGSYVGGRVASADARVAAFLCIAPVLNHYDYGFLRRARCRIAILAPGQDEFSDPGKLDGLVASLPRAPWLRIVDTDHLFRTAWVELPRACRDAVAWLDGPGDGPA
ncbi:MAG: alpha/beta hydrolase [Candidatus Methylomirabilales bacterium]